MAVDWKKIIERLKAKYKLVVLNDETFEERASFTLTRLNVYIALSSITVVLVLIVSSLIVFTPLREFIPGYADLKTRKNLILMLNKVDSLQNQLRSNRSFLTNLNNVIAGGNEIANTAAKKEKLTLIDSIQLKKEHPKEDQKLRQMVENEGGGDYLTGDLNPATTKGLESYSFFAPIKGNVLHKFQPASSFYGVEISAQKNEAIKSCLDGTVIMSQWSPESGYVTAIQHNNNLISIYKHNSILLQKVGNFVRAGDVIAIVGEFGNANAGLNLHLELWYNGSPVNPLDYINF